MDTKKTGLKRDTIDKFYTKKEIVKACIANIKKHIVISDDDIIIEPSAGNGSFIKKIKKLTKNYKFFDINPEHKTIIKQDFLDFNYNDLENKYNKIHIIGNPPFGRQSSMAIKFIKLCCSFAHSISFILPKSFKKDSMKKHFGLDYHLLFEMNLDNNSFLIDGIDANVPCIFQIWERQTYKRKLNPKMFPINFNFVHKEEQPDISVRRVGVYAGKITTDIKDKSIQSHYFIKFTNNKTLNENIDNLKNIIFDTDNTVGPKSISKQELIKEFNILL